MIFTFLTLSAFILLIFRFLHIIKSKLSFPANIKRYVYLLLPVIEFIAWFAFAIWFFIHVYRTQNNSAIIATSLIFILFIIPVIIFSRDFIVGFALKIQNKINEGSYIEIETIKGKIKNAGHFRLDVIDNKGNINSVPYHVLQSKTIKKQNDNNDLVKIHLSFTFPKTTKVQTIVPELLIKIMNTPWIAASHNPMLEESKIESDKLTIIVGAYTINELYRDNIQEMVQGYFNNK